MWHSRLWLGCMVRVPVEDYYGIMDGGLWMGITDRGCTSGLLLRFMVEGLYLGVMLCIAPSTGIRVMSMESNQASHPALLVHGHMMLVLCLWSQTKPTTIVTGTHTPCSSYWIKGWHKGVVVHRESRDRATFHGSFNADRGSYRGILMLIEGPIEAF